MPRHPDLNPPHGKGIMAQLPMNVEPEIPPFDLAAPVEVPGDALPVLVVEDDRPTRLLLERMIRARGHDVHGCESAEAAEEILSQKFFPLIVLDIQLPGISGLDFSRRVRAHPTGRSYYILAGTGNNRPDDLRQVLDAGADDYIAKPYHPGLLDVRLAVAEAAVQNLAERRRLEHDLAFLAEHDPLTKLFNRRRLPVAVDTAIGAARNGLPGALLYIDLDNFKVVNDTLGHDAGDRLLLCVADILRSSVREDDVLVRFGGDEFVIILPDCEVKDAMEIGESLRQKIEGLVFAEGERVFRVGASIGVSPIDGTKSAADVIGVADAACYAAKSRGRNRVELHNEDASALAALVADADWTTRIRDAMAAGTLRLFFQPVVSTVDYRIFFHEALLRLCDREGASPVPPGAFMSSLHRSGQTAALDRFVIERAVSALENASDDVCISINLCGSSFAAEDFEPFVVRLLESRGIRSSQIIFELTESEVIGNVRHAGETMNSLRRRGVRFALDDFGAGTSSLNYLKSLPIDMMKVDGSFVRNLREDPFNRAVVKACHAFSTSLGIPAIAEHVERPDLLSDLAAMQIEYAQGYLIGKPAPELRTEQEIRDAIQSAPQ